MNRCPRILPLLQLALLVLLSVGAAPAAAEAPLVPARLCGAHPEGANSELLFFRLPGGVGAAGSPGRIEVEVTLDDQPFLTEELELRGDAAETAPVVELLAWHPQELALLFQEAQKDPERVHFRITAEGLAPIDLGWSELLAQSRGLLAEGFRPQPVSSAVDIAALEATLRSMAASVVYCDTCLAQYQICQGNNCVAELPPRLCDLCDTQYFACLNTCVPRPCAVTTEIKYEYWRLYQVYSLGVGCFYDIIYHPDLGHEFEEEMWMWKRVKKQITHNADCTTTETVLEVVYYQDYCYQRWFWDCCAFWDNCNNQYPFIGNRRNQCWY